jgi:hypothetical protein
LFAGFLPRFSSALPLLLLILVAGGRGRPPLRFCLLPGFVLLFCALVTKLIDGFLPRFSSALP